MKSRFKKKKKREKKKEVQITKFPSISSVFLKMWSLGRHQHHLVTYWKCTFVGLIPGLLNQRLWGLDHAICRPADPDALEGKHCIGGSCPSKDIHVFCCRNEQYKSDY